MISLLGFGYVKSAELQMRTNLLALGAVEHSHPLTASLTVRRNPGNGDVNKNNMTAWIAKC